MTVKVKFFTSLREITGKKTDEILLQNTVTVKELLTLLSDKYGKPFKEYVYNRKGDVQDFLSFLVNGKNINVLEGFDTKLKQGDVIAILPPVGEGVYFLGTISWLIAASMGYVSLVSAFAGLQHFFVFVYVIVSSLFIPQHLKEELGRGVIVLKLSAIALMIAGTWLITV